MPDMLYGGPMFPIGTVGRMYEYPNANLSNHGFDICFGIFHYDRYLT
jgi:hypothetical protein